MVDAAHMLWRELLGTRWVLILLPSLAVLRLLLSTRRPSQSAAGAPYRARWRRTTARSEAPDQPGEPGAPEDQPGSVVEPRSDNPASLTAADARRQWLLDLVDPALVALGLVFLVIRPFLLQFYYIPSPSMAETLQVNDRILVNKLIYRFHAPERGDIVVFEPPARALDGRTPPTDDWVKRVIGVPGDRVAVRQNHLILNGVPQQEPYAALLDPVPGGDDADAVTTGEYDYQFPDEIGSGIPQGRSAYVQVAPGATVLDRQYTVTLTSDRQPRRGNDYLFFLRNDPVEGLEAVVPPGHVFLMGDNRNDSEDSHYWGCLEEKRVLGKAFCIFWPFSHARLLSRG